MIVRKTFSRTTFKFNFIFNYLLILFGLIQCNSGQREIVPSVTENRNKLYPVEFKDEVVSFQQAEVLLKNKKTVIIDVRNTERYKQGHIQFALNISIQDSTFNMQIGNLNKEHHYFIYGEGKDDAMQAVTIFRAKGFGSLKLFEGGLIEWENSGGSIVK